MAEDSSLTQRAYVELRAGLISCRFPPGSKLNISQLQRSLGVSQAAVREALSRLTSEGLAEIQRHSGFCAAPISVEGYRELASACLTLEIPLLRSSIANGDLAWEGSLLSAYHIASRMLEQAASNATGLDTYVGHREEFHRLLFAACDNRWLLWSWSLLYSQQLRFRHTFSDLARFEAKLDEDYRAFLDVVIRRDVEEAVRLWTENHDKVTEFIEDNLGPQDLERQALVAAG